VTVTKGKQSKRILFDFGLSPGGTALNADLLGCDLSRVEAAAVSHGHDDHLGGLAEIIKQVGKKNIELSVHPAVLRSPRDIKFGNRPKTLFPEYTQDRLESTGVKLVMTETPATL
jgi:7,8-dihydropterin-6-yl-methyl-4-(beta-D-ribofuranosyl)aminobenzene 5'-phosphate synthase